MRKLILLLLATSFSTTCIADTLIKFKDSSQPQSAMYIKNGRLSMSSDKNNQVIFDSTKQQFMMIDHKKKSYMVFTQADLEKLGDVVNSAMAQLDAQLAQMPPAQREQMKRMMQSQMGAMMPKKDKPMIVHTGKHKKVAGYDCEVVTVELGRVSKGESCVADANDLGIPADDMRAFAGLQEFSKSMMEKLPDMGQDFGLTSMNPREFPVSYRHGKTRGELQSISTDTVDEKYFTVPSGYKKQEMPGIGGRG
ncbi:MAG: DUF4412 domain-containing protein [bacterium]